MIFDRAERRRIQRADSNHRQRTAQTMQHAHRLIAKTAKEMAGEWYEAAAHDDAFYAHYPDLYAFVDVEWHLFISMARIILGSMLRGNYPQTMKDEIYEALTKDKTLPRPDNVWH